MKTTYRICVLIVIVGVASGCALTVTQRDAAADFAQASSEIGEFASKEFGHFRSATIDMNVTDVAIRGHAKIDNLDGAMNPDRIIERVKAAQALSSYGRLLLSLVNETQETELKQASTGFVDSFSTINNRQMSDSQLEGLGRLVQGIGSFWVEAKKAQAVKEIVPAAMNDVNKLCDLLIRDMSPQQDQMATGFETTIRQLKQDADSALESPGTSYADRLIAINGRRKAHEESEHLAKISSQAVRSLETLKEANAQLANALRHDSHSIDDIRMLGKEINSLRIAMDSLAYAN